jgi:branched-subunit amino acid aminotransferase/4-amino-4-deoxychorismate lyase
LGVIVHLNGRLVPADEAQVSVFDRGFLFGDGVYEGLRAFGGRVHSVKRHEERLREGLDATGIPGRPDELGRLCSALIEANGLTDAFVYVQYTRGTPGPGHAPRMRVPDGPMEPTVFGLCMAQPPIDRYVDVPTMKACCPHSRRTGATRRRRS